jgi:glutaredoxin
MWLRAIKRILRYRRPKPDLSARALEVVLYSRRGCHLCDDAKALLDEVKRSYAFDIAVVDIDTDSELIRFYGEQVPVVSVNGKVRFRGMVNRVLLKRILAAEANQTGED